MDSMNDDWPQAARAPRQRAKSARIGRSAALVAGGLVTGAALAGALSASASTDTSTPAVQSSGEGAAPGGRPGGIGGPNPVRSDEKAVTDAQAATLRAAALKAVPGGTVVRIETDAGDGAYEVHMTKTDGSVVTVKFDENLAVIRLEDGMGQGDPRPAGGTGDGQRDAGGRQGGGAPGAETPPSR